MEKKELLIYYNTGRIETINRLEMLIHFIEIGVIKFAYDMTDGKAWIRNEHGQAEKIIVTNITHS